MVCPLTTGKGFPWVQDNSGITPTVPSRSVCEIATPAVFAPLVPPTLPAALTLAELTQTAQSETSNATAIKENSFESLIIIASQEVT